MFGFLWSLDVGPWSFGRLPRFSSLDLRPIFPPSLHACHLMRPHSSCQDFLSSLTDMSSLPVGSHQSHPLPRRATLGGDSEESIKACSTRRNPRFKVAHSGNDIRHSCRSIMLLGG